MIRANLSADIHTYNAKALSQLCRPALNRRPWVGERYLYLHLPRLRSGVVWLLSQHSTKYLLLLAKQLRLVCEVPKYAFVTLGWRYVP